MYLSGVTFIQQDFGIGKFWRTQISIWIAEGSWSSGGHTKEAPQVKCLKTRDPSEFHRAMRYV